MSSKVWFMWWTDKYLNYWEFKIKNLYIQIWCQDQGCQVFTTNPSQLQLKTMPFAFRGGPPVKIVFWGIKFTFFGRVPQEKFTFQGLNIMLLGSLQPVDMEKQPTVTFTSSCAHIILALMVNRFGLMSAMEGSERPFYASSDSPP